MAKKDYSELADLLIELVGGKGNIFNLSHCNTRLRFSLKDDSLPKDEEIGELSDIMGVARGGGQYQVIVGFEVSKVYAALSKKLDLENPIEEVKKEKLTLKKVGSNILGALSGSVTPLLPVIMASSMFKMLAAILGPTVFNLIGEGNALYTLFSIAGDAGFYFFPILLGYTSAKHFETTPVLGMFLGAILMHPTMLQMAADKVDFNVFGIPAIPENYANSLIPIILSCWVMSYVEKLFKKHLPDALKMVFVPTFTVLVMLPLMLCVLGPVGYFVGNAVIEGLFALQNSPFGFIGVAFVAASFQVIVMTGTHVILIAALVASFAAGGHEAFVNPGCVISTMAVAGMCLGAFLQEKEADKKIAYFGCFIAEIFGGVTEPGIYTIGIPYKRPFMFFVVGGGIGGLVAGLLGVDTFALIPNGSLFSLAAFLGGPMQVTIAGLGGCLIAFVISGFLTYKFGFSSKKQS